MSLVTTAFLISLFIPYAVKSEKNLANYPAWTILPIFPSVFYILMILNEISFPLQFHEDLNFNEFPIKCIVSIILLGLNFILIYLIFTCNKSEKKG